MLVVSRISKELIRSSLVARQKYLTYLESQQFEAQKGLKLEIRKSFEAEIEVMRKKNQQLEKDITSLSSDADRNSVTAEELQSFTHIT